MNRVYVQKGWWEDMLAGRKEGTEGRREGRGLI